MNNHFVADGARRLELRDKKAALHKSILATHADELAAANWFQKLRLQYTIWREFRSKWARIKPSDYSLYSVQTKI